MLVTIEGGDGAGKTTQAARLEQRLTASGFRVTLVHEPGSTALGQRLREWLKSDTSTDPIAELLLFEAARAQLVAEVIRPALDGGQVVISDRFTDSTLAYQGFGRGLDLDLIRHLNDVATGGLVPDVTVLLSAPPSDALRRASGRRSSPDQSRFEDLDPRFHERVAAGFAELAAQDPARWVVIDSTRDVDGVAASMWAAVHPRLGATGSARR